MTGAVIYRGPSRLDGAPIAAIVTSHSLNSKTGDMAQAWILRSDVAPHVAIRDGRDKSICGDCVHRSGSHIGRSCYVVTHFAPLNVWRVFERGEYPEMTPSEIGEQLRGRAFRLAAYGDPAAVPFGVWRSVLAGVSRLAAYTHAWRYCDPRFRDFLMASVETEAEADHAHALGWRTFRARRPQDPLRVDEITCPASDEAGHRVTCDRCGLCSGLTRPTARSIAILLHGRRTAWLQPAEV